MDGAEFVFRDGPKGFVRVWKKVILDPWEFYREMPSSGGFENPLIFLGISAIFYFLLRLAVFCLANAVNALFLIILAYIFGPGILILACGLFI